MSSQVAEDHSSAGRGLVGSATQRSMHNEGSDSTAVREDQGAKPLSALTCVDLADEFRRRLARSGSSW